MRQIQEALATPVGASADFDEVLILLFGKKAHLRKTGSTHNMSKHFSKYVEIILFNNIWKQDELEARAGRSGGGRARGRGVACTSSEDICACGTISKANIIFYAEQWFEWTDQTSGRDGTLAVASSLADIGRDWPDIAIPLLHRYPGAYLYECCKFRLLSERWHQQLFVSVWWHQQLTACVTPVAFCANHCSCCVIYAIIYT